MTPVNGSAPRVVVTGLGLVTPLGTGIEKTWEALVAGRSGAGPITRFDARDFRAQIGCEANDFDASEWMDYRDARRFDRVVQFAMVAALQAMQESCLSITPQNAERVGVLIGTGIGGLETIHEGYQALLRKGPNRVNPLTGAMMLPDLPSGQVAIMFGALGPNFCVVSACATGSHAIGEAAEIIRRGDADVMVAGATEAPLTPFGVAAFHRSGAVSTRNEDPQGASRPFDALRDGFVVGEGAGLIVLERLEHALDRGATPLVELVGYGATADAYHVSAPLEDGSGAARAMRMALNKAGLAVEDIDYINAHGTSTRMNDVSETRAIKTVFGERAYDLPISSTKSMHGHLLGAAGGAEAVITALTLLRNVIPPTINYEVPDPDCDLDYVPNVARVPGKPLRTALSNSFGFGGHNATLIFQRHAESP
jgi:3-oxoacyl-[acyl-carrier-protein] synthase II